MCGVVVVCPYNRMVIL